VVSLRRLCHSRYQPVALRLSVRRPYLQRPVACVLCQCVGCCGKDDAWGDGQSRLRLCACGSASSQGFVATTPYKRIIDTTDIQGKNITSSRTPERTLGKPRRTRLYTAIFHATSPSTASSRFARASLAAAPAGAVGVSSCGDDPCRVHAQPTSWLMRSTQHNSCTRPCVRREPSRNVLHAWTHTPRQVSRTISILTYMWYPTYT